MLESQSGFKTVLKSNEQEVLCEMFYSLGNKSFMIHQALDFDPVPLDKSYYEEDIKLIQNIKMVARSSIAESANVICSHTIFKFILDNDQ